MGKKKNKSEKSNQTDKNEPKAQKSYSYGADAKIKSSAAQAEEEDLIKVQIPAKTEAAILDLILDHMKTQALSGSASSRLTTKKLTDMYTSLSQTGFRHGQIEAAMSNTVQYGGDLADTLDWLCLNTPNDQLPSGFSQSLAQEDQKKRPKFNVELVTPPPTVSTADPGTSKSPQATSLSEPVDQKPSQANMKSWILQYADHDSDPEELDDFGNVKIDPNEKYLELTALLLDARTAASQAKVKGDKAQAKQIGTKIRKYIQEMDTLETDPGFNPAIKIKDIDIEKTQAKQDVSSIPADPVLPPAAEAAGNQAQTSPKVVKAAKKETREDSKDADDSMNCEGFALFEEQAAATAPDPKEKAKTTKAAKPEKRSFTYTRQQWTGKSPKQFLIDWVRKHLPKSPAPSYKHIQAGGNLWKSRVRVIQKEGDLDVCVEDIVCENVKEAENLSCTLALYKLCKGQRVYQLLPPPYRDVWLDWQEQEDGLRQQTIAQENKPRDQLITRLLKKCKIDNTKTRSGSGSDDDDVEETWEDLDVEEMEEVKATASRQTSHYRPKAVTSDRLKAILKKNSETQKHRTLLETRKQLPVYHYRENILDVVRHHSVVVIAGETGSGKSTQIPQFLLENLIEESTASVPNIVCTQPRRISAMSLAGRVSDELGEPGPGRGDGLCGYQIRFESKRSESTRLVYCTTGVVLRQLQQDPQLKEVSYIIVDEVHERSVQSDFLIIILRRLLERRPDLKVILMSATLDAHKFSSYFKHCPVIEIPGRTFPVDVHHVEDLLEMTGFTLDSDSPYCLRDDRLIQEYQSTLHVTSKGGDVAKMSVDWTKDNISTIDMTDLDPNQYSLKTRNIITRSDPKVINLDLIMELIVYLDTDPTYSAIDGAILVFLPGLVHIQDLFDNLKSDRRFSDEHRYKIVALHSVLSSQDQSAAFTVPPPGTRKIVLATNIAETGITIPDVVFVIDSGKVKENRYIESTQLSSLEEVYISQASAKQRQGRAGRVREGVCFRMYPRAKYDSLKPYSIPEMLRVPLEELCLHIMKCDLGNPADFLGQALDPPQEVAINRAMSILREVGACEPLTPTLTPLGLHLAALPVNVRIGKMLVYSAIFGCLEPMAIISASLTEKSPFVTPMGKRDQADVAKMSLATESSDHLTLLKAFLLWKAASERGYHAEMSVCQKFYLKRNNLVETNNIAQDLIKLVHASGFTDTNVKSHRHRDSHSQTSLSFTADQLNSKMAATIKSILAAGLYPNIVHVRHTPKVDSAANQDKQICVALSPQGPIQVHPSSVNRFLGANGWLAYHEKVKLRRPYIRDSSLISAYPLLLFGGDIDVQHKDQVITVDGWIKLKAFAKTAVIFKELRKLISNLLAEKVRNPKMSVSDDPVVNVILQLVGSEKYR